MGTPQIGAKVLQSLLDLKQEVIAVICQPDRLVNRKKEVVYQPVKTLALAHNIPVLQPNKVKEITDQVAELKPDLIITCAFGQFINTEILNIPKYGCYNVHASLLPKLRGGAPIHWAVINGESQSGVTLMKMVKKMDAGDIITQLACELDPRETMSSLYVKLEQLAYNIIQRDFVKLCQVNVPSTPQNEEEATFGYNITKEEEILNFHQPVKQVDQWVRGLYNKPMAIWAYNGLNIKVHEAYPTNIRSTLAPGTITKLDKTGLYIATVDFDLQITRLQLPNKNVVGIKELLNGNHPFK